MFDAGIWELSLILVIALLVVGPDRLPKLATSVGRWVAKVKRLASTVQSSIDTQIAKEDQDALRKQVAKIRTDAGEMSKSISSSLNQDVMTPLADKPDQASGQTSGDKPKDKDAP